MTKLPLGTPAKNAADDAELVRVMLEPVAAVTPAELKRLRSIANKAAWRVASETRRLGHSVPDDDEDEDE